MLSSHLWENVIHNKLILIIDGTIGYVKRGTWHKGEAPNGDIADPIPTK